MLKTKINILAIIIILFGFVAPYVSGGRLGPIWFFWIGFAIILFGTNAMIGGLSLKWARIGFIFHFTGSIFSICLFYLLSFVDLQGQNLINVLLYWAPGIFIPVSRVASIVYPVPIVRISEDITQSSISFLRGGILSFLDVLFYVLVGLIVGLVLTNKKKSSKKGKDNDGFQGTAGDRGP